MPAWRGFSARRGCVSPLLFQVGRLLHLAGSRRLQLFPLALRRRDAVLDRLAHRVVRVADRLTRTLRRSAGTLDGLTAAQLDRLAAEAVDLVATRPRRDVRPDRRSDETAEDEPAKTAAATAAATVVLASHRVPNLLLPSEQGSAPPPSRHALPS